MSIKYSDHELRSRGVIWCSWEGPTRGVDTHSGDTKLLPDHVPFVQNMHLPHGRPEGVNGYALLDTTFDTSDNATPYGFGQYINTGGTEQYILLQADGRVVRWNAAGNALVNLATAGILPTTAGTRYDVQQYEDYLIFTHTTDNWKWDGTNFLPLGARIINNAEATTDWALTGTGQAGLSAGTSTFAFGLAALTSDAMLANEVATLTYDPSTDIEDAGLLLARDYLESDKFCFWFRVTTAANVDTTNTLFRVETSSGNDFDVPLSAWTDEAGTVITLADNTWHRIEHVISSGTENGTFDMTTVDNVHFVIDTNGSGGITWFLDMVYWRYTIATTMPGAVSCAVWKNVFFGFGSTADPANVYFGLAGGPDEYNALATIAVNADDGYQATVCRRFFNQVFLGKQQSVHSLGGSLTGLYPNYSFEVLDITEEHGCDGFRSIVEAHKKLYFPWKTRLYEYDGTGTKPISNVILPDLADFEETRVGQKTAAYYKRRNEMWLYYPGNGDTHNVRRVRLDFENPGFIGVENGMAGSDRINICLTVTESDREILVGIDPDGDVMNLDPLASTSDFDGTAIVRIFRLPWDAAGIPERMKYWGDLVILFGAQSSGTVSCRYRIAEHPREFDSASFVEAGTVDTAAVDTLGWIQISEVSRWIQIEFRTSAVQFDLQYPIRWEAILQGRWA